MYNYDAWICHSLKFKDMYYVLYCFLRRLQLQSSRPSQKEVILPSSATRGESAHHLLAFRENPFRNGEWLISCKHMCKYLYWFPAIMGLSRNLRNTSIHPRTFWPIGWRRRSHHLIDRENKELLEKDMLLESDTTVYQLRATYKAGFVWNNLILTNLYRLCVRFF